MYKQLGSQDTACIQNCIIILPIAVIGMATKDWEVIIEATEPQNCGLKNTSDSWTKMRASTFLSLNSQKAVSQAYPHSQETAGY